MNEIHGVLRRAGARLLLSGLMRSLVFALSVLVGAAVVLRVVQQLFGLGVEWSALAPWGVGAAVAGAVVWAVLRRPDRMEVARRVDEGADLREHLSTALSVADDRGPWARATVETAAARAKEVDVRRAVPVEPPRFWPVPVAMALVLAVLWLTLPTMDLFGRQSAQAEEAERDRVLVEAVAQAEEAQRRVAELVSRLDVKPDDDDEDVAGRPMDRRDPEAVRRAAARQLTSLQDRLEQFRRGEDGRRSDALRESMRQLRTPGDGPLNDFARALAQGNFSEAAEALAQQMSRLSSGQMSDSERERLREQMRDLSEQLKQLSERQRELERRLEQAGIDPEKARNLDELREALERAEHLSEEQRRELMEMARAMQQAAQMCDGLGSCLGQMAASMSEGGLGAEGMDALGEMLGQLSEMEMLAFDMEAAMQGMEEARRQLDLLAGFMECDNPGLGECDGGLWGTGPGWGQGDGGGFRDSAPVESDRTPDRARSQTQAGPIIGSRLVYGEQVRGESRAEFAEAVAAGERIAADAIESNEIPREFERVVKHYFGNLRARTRAERETAGDDSGGN